jgi:hypothetical protein
VAQISEICKPVHTPATADGSLVMSRGKRFESLVGSVFTRVLLASDAEAREDT